MSGLQEEALNVQACDAWAPELIAVTAPRFAPEQVLAYGELTQDMNPIHVDDAFAAASRFGRTIVHGLFVMAPVWRALEAAFGTRVLSGMTAELRFVAPVFVDTTPTYRIALETADVAHARYLIEVLTEAGGPAIAGAATIARPA